MRVDLYWFQPARTRVHRPQDRLIHRLRGLTAQRDCGICDGSLAFVGVVGFTFFIYQSRTDKSVIPGILTTLQVHREKLPHIIMCRNATIPPDPGVVTAAAVEHLDNNARSPLARALGTKH